MLVCDFPSASPALDYTDGVKGESFGLNNKVRGCQTVSHCHLAYDPLNALRCSLVYTAPSVPPRIDTARRWENCIFGSICSCVSPMLTANCPSPSEPTLIAKSSLLLDVKPWDDETDMAKLEECVRSIQMEGLVWGQCKNFLPPPLTNQSLCRPYDDFFHHLSAEHQMTPF